MFHMTFAHIVAMLVATPIFFILVYLFFRMAGAAWYKSKGDWAQQLSKSSGEYRSKTTNKTEEIQNGQE